MPLHPGNVTIICSCDNSGYQVFFPMCLGLRIVLVLVMISLVVAIACITAACVVIKHELYTWTNFGSIIIILFTVIENVALI